MPAESLRAAHLNFATASQRQKRPMTWIDFVRYLAALSVLMTLCMDTIVPLRGLAIASNVLFIVYGIAGQPYPVLLLHAVKFVRLRLQVRGVNVRPKT